ncbi:helix-turn-helix domain-containing protein [Leucobacter sp. NPDC015123]|uniref:PucR family transcriptional regulator n=1 Tax=Leucobacter sp. NPDC015123 TaxID=3364129 RepID=UPI0036F46840
MAGITDAVQFFDGLLTEARSREAILSQAAVAIRGTVAVRFPGGDRIVRVSPAAEPQFTRQPNRVNYHGPDGIHVWHQDAADGVPDDFLPRLAVALRIAAHWDRAPGDANHAIQTLFRPETAAGAKTAALAELSLLAEQPIRVLAIGGNEKLAEHFAEQGARSSELYARMRYPKYEALLVSASFTPERVGPPPQGVLAAFSGVFPADRADWALRNAQDALRFTSLSRQRSPLHLSRDEGWRNGGELHSIAALTSLPRAKLRTLEDVQILERLRKAHGDRVLHVLEAFATTTSVRGAGSELYMHRNTVAHWVRKAEQAFGYSLSQPYARAVLFVSLCMHHLVYRSPEITA